MQKFKDYTYMLKMKAENNPNKLSYDDLNQLREELQETGFTLKYNCPQDKLRERYIRIGEEIQYKSNLILKEIKRVDPIKINLITLKRGDKY